MFDCTILIHIDTNPLFFYMRMQFHINIIKIIFLFIQSFQYVYINLMIS